MATTYVPSIRGYINDVPEIWFKRRSDGKVFHFDEISDASATPNVEFTEVNGGWSLYPVAYLPAASTMEMTFTSAQFSGDLFAMANDTNFEEEQVVVPVTEKVTVIAGNKATFTTQANDIEDFVINGLTVGADDGAAGTPTAGNVEFKFTGSKAPYTCELAFNAADVAVGDTIEVTYYEKKTASVIKIDNTTTAVGELILKYPKKKWAM